MKEGKGGKRLSLWEKDDRGEKRKGEERCDGEESYGEDEGCDGDQGTEKEV